MLAQVVERIAALCRKGADGRGIQVATEPVADPGGSVQLACPEADFATVLAMLTLHAIDTAPDASQVELAALPDGVEVRATGDARADRGLTAIAADPARGFTASGIDGFLGEPGAFGPAWLTLASCGVRLEVEHAAGLRRIRLVQQVRA